MPPTPDDPLQSPQDSDTDTSSSAIPRTRPFSKGTIASIGSLPYRRSTASLTNLFASTTSLPGSPTLAGSGSESGAATPTVTAVNGSVFSPGTPTTNRPASPSIAGTQVGSSDARELVIRGFCPHVSILASQDTEELIRHKGVNGGLLELLRPFGQQVQGKVTIRDSTGVSRSWEDFGIRFVGVKDGLEPSRPTDRTSIDSSSSTHADPRRLSLLEYKPARLRSGGDVPQIEDLIERHLTFAEEQSGPIATDYLNHKDVRQEDAQATSTFYMHYLRRLLSGMPLVPSESIPHPVASVIAISSRSPAPIEELRNLYASSNSGDHRLPQWVHNEFLRYYVLVHDEDYDDITKSMALFDQMKRHFGLHCHLLRLRSTQCLPSDDGSTKLPNCEWLSAAEELAEITSRETSEDDEDPTPCIFETDATAVRAFVREMVTQSIVPSMERASATWNDQVASRRRGLSGRFMSLSKRFTTFGSRASSGSAIGTAGSNYDNIQGFYRPDSPEALMRKLADYSMMLRDYKLAQSTYEILCQDFKNDKAWRYYAAANEMAAVSTLLATGSLSTRARTETVDQYLEAAYYSYLTRVGAPYNALRTILLGIELLKPRGGSALDDAARWSNRLLDDRLVGPVGHVLLMERIAACYTERREPTSTTQNGTRHRKAAFWNMLAADSWLRLEKASQAEKRLTESLRLYHLPSPQIHFPEMAAFLSVLQETVSANRHGPRGHIDEADLLTNPDDLLSPQVETLQDPLLDNHHHPRSEQGKPRTSLSLHTNTAPPVVPGQAIPGGATKHRKSLSVQTSLSGAQTGQIPTAFDDPLGVVPSAYEEGGGGTETMQSFAGGGGGGGPPLSPAVQHHAPRSPTLERRDPREEGFE